MYCYIILIAFHFRILGLPVAGGDSLHRCGGCRSTLPGQPDHDGGRPQPGGELRPSQDHGRGAQDRGENARRCHADDRPQDEDHVDVQQGRRRRRRSLERIRQPEKVQYVFSFLRGWKKRILLCVFRNALKSFSPRI